MAKLMALMMAMVIGYAAAAPGYGGGNDESCVYSDWTPWSPCSAACNQPGFSSRSRVILYEPEDHYGFSSSGEHCDTSSLEEWRDCFGEVCEAPASDCQMSYWSSWCACSASCGTGQRHRGRTIIADASGGGAPCEGLDEIEPCNNGPCQQDCVQGEWSAWGACNTANGNICGPGTRDRVRQTFANPTFGGIPCGPDSEWDACDLGPCAVDCAMSQWTAWTACSAPCGSGTRDRSRSILQNAINGGLPCGPISDWQTCDNGPCQQDCVQSQWSTWSVCRSQNSRCGPGQRDRSRQTITNAAFGGIPCGPDSEYDACDNGPCAQDCIMGDWSRWGSCSAPCGQGTRDRSRSIVQNAAYGGLACSQTSDWEACDNGPCAQDCALGQWSEWSQCPSCGQAQRTRFRQILQEGRFGGLTCDQSSLSETESCPFISCAVDCQMSDWSSWTACSASCGAGTRDRSRSIIQNALNGGRQCGPTSDWQACDSGPCQQDCVQSQWSQWSRCNSQNPSCGPGKRDRSRQTLTRPAYGGIPCGSDSEWENCDNGPCAQDCALGQWSAWSQCPSCGQAQRSRFRQIVQEGRFGGQTCDQSSLAETESCPFISCAVDCRMGQWEAWGVCDQPCGDGKRSRVRSILTYPSNGGQQCPEKDQCEPCNNGPCQQDCVQSEWSKWTACSVTCGTGTRQRSRSTLSPARFGGAPCGTRQESEPCSPAPHLSFATPPASYGPRPTFSSPPVIRSSYGPRPTLSSPPVIRSSYGSRPTFSSPPVQRRSHGSPRQASPRINQTPKLILLQPSLPQFNPSRYSAPVQQPIQRSPRLTYG